MYNQQIEELINAALADGVLSEKEIQILFKKAQTMGIDLDEFKMVLDARLVEKSKADRAEAEKSAPKSNKLGDVKKCPSCGAIVQQYQGRCPGCKYEFENLEANSSAQKLADALAKEESQSRKKEIIRNFPIPNTKTDLFEFITSLQTRMESDDDDAIKSKLKECILKANSLFPSDPLLKNLIASAEKNLKKKKTSKILETIFLIAFVVAIYGLITWACIPKPSKNAKKCASKIEKMITANNLSKATNYVVNFKWKSKESSKWEKQNESLEPAFIDLATALGEAGDEANALKVFNVAKTQMTYGETDKDVQKVLFQKFLEKKDYDVAWKFHSCTCIRKADNAVSVDDVKTIVNSILTDGQKDKAKQFVLSHGSGIYYENGSSLDKQTSAQIQAEILEYIDQY